MGFLLFGHAILLVFADTSPVNTYKACACKNHFRQLVVKIQE